MSEEMQVDQAVVEAKTEEPAKDEAAKEAPKEDSATPSTESQPAADAPAADPVTTTAAAGDASAKPEAAKETAPPQASKKVKSDVDMAGLSTRQYLDTTVVPILLQALSALAKERPPSPIEYVANYLLKHKSSFEGGNQQTPAPEK